MANWPAPMYAQLPVFKYQTFDPGTHSYSLTPISRPYITPSRYYHRVTDLPPKSEETLNEPPADLQTSETPSEMNSQPAEAESAVSNEG